MLGYIYMGPPIWGNFHASMITLGPSFGSYLTRSDLRSSMVMDVSARTVEITTCRASGWLNSCTGAERRGSTARGRPGHSIPNLFCTSNPNPP